MPLIKPRTRGKQLVKHRTRLDCENNETLYAYAQFLGESTEYVLNQVIDTVLDSLRRSDLIALNSAVALAAARIDGRLNSIARSVLRENPGNPNDLVKPPGDATLRGAGELGWPFKVEMIEMLGAERLVHGGVGQAQFTVRVDATLAAPKVGDQLTLQAPADHLHWFDAATGHRVD